VAALVIAGALGVALRASGRRELHLLDGDSVWRLTYDVRFDVERPGARIRVALPADTPHSRVFRQDVSYSDLTAERMRPSRSESRELSLSAVRAGEYRIVARLDLHLCREARWQPNGPVGPLRADDRAQALRATPTIQVNSPAVENTLRSLRNAPGRSADLVHALFEFCAFELEPGGDTAPDDAAGALETGRAGPLGRVRAFVALCRASKMAARLVTGFEIRETAGLRPHTWAEVLVGEAWVPYDPENGYSGEMPHRFVPVRRDGVEIVHTSGARDLEASYALMRLPPGSGPWASRPRHVLDILDLTRLPLEVHQVLSLILLLPLGALVTSVFRTMIGIRTFGTFTPALIALSFVFADWRTGVLVFAAVLALGLASRSLLERLKLLMVPRLSVVLTLVVLSIVFLVSVLDYYGLTPSAQAVLLPMVILTMTVERFYVTTEEDGVRFALQLLGGTVLVAFCCFLVLCWNRVGRMLLAYPELHLFTLAALVLVGRYTGYRLSELWRFRDLAGPGSEDRRA
jgi:transglutaminase-like putative cysteine protease